MYLHSVFLYFVSYLHIPMLFYLEDMEQMSVIPWLLFPTLIHINPLFRQYTIILTAKQP